MKSFDQIREKHLTPAEMKKREEVAKAIKRENPNMPMAKKMAIATATAKKVAEGVQDMASMGNRSLSRIAGTIGHPDSAAAKNELARRRMKNEERVISGGYRDQDGKYHPPKTASSIAKDRLAKKAAIMKKTAAAMRKEETELDEATDMSKLKLLARAGLVDQKDVERLMAAFKVMQAGKPLTQQQKDLVISSYGELASIVTGDSQTFQKAKKAVAEAIDK